MLVYGFIETAFIYRRKWKNSGLLVKLELGQIFLLENIITCGIKELQVWYS